MKLSDYRTTLTAMIITEVVSLGELEETNLAVLTGIQDSVGAIEFRTSLLQFAVCLEGACKAVGEEVMGIWGDYDLEFIPDLLNAYIAVSDDLSPEAPVLISMILRLASSKTRTDDQKVHLLDVVKSFEIYAVVEEVEEGDDIVLDEWLSHSAAERELTRALNSDADAYLVPQADLIK